VTSIVCDLYCDICFEAIGEVWILDVSVIDEPALRTSEGLTARS
jgi:hypothetical protein